MTYVVDLLSTKVNANASFYPRAGVRARITNFRFARALRSAPRAELSAFLNRVAPTPTEAADYFGARRAGELSQFSILRSDFSWATEFWTRGLRPGLHGDNRKPHAKPVEQPKNPAEG